MYFEKGIAATLIALSGAVQLPPDMATLLAPLFVSSGKQPPKGALLFFECRPQEKWGTCSSAV
jgi:hypothetical protein